MEHLEQLRSEFEEIKRKLAFPLDLEDFRVELARRESVLLEARRLAETLNLSGNHWFSV